MTQKIKLVLDNAKESFNSKKVDKDRVRLMSRERMERTDKLVKMRSLYNDRPGTGKSAFGKR